ncbi:MAG: PEP-CTERM sorting domain-containing protein [Armatimonadota bacterium]
MLKVIVACLMLAMAASCAMAVTGDTWNANAQYNAEIQQAPWSYLYQLGSAWDTTFNFDIMESTGAVWYAPGTPEYFGQKCGVSSMWGRLLVNSCNNGTWNNSEGPGQAFVGFTAPSAGAYKFNGDVYSLSGLGEVWAKSATNGSLFNGNLAATYSSSAFNFTTNLAAGETVYFGGNILAGAGSFLEAQNMWAIDVTQTSAVVPEPGSMISLVMAIAGFAGLSIKRKH